MTLPDVLELLRVSTLVLLAAMFTAIGLGMRRGSIDLTRAEHVYSVLARSLAGASFALNATRGLLRPPPDRAVEPDWLLILGVASVTVAALWMVLASLPVQAWIDHREDERRRRLRAT